MAGIIEGEGCFSTNTGPYGVKLTVKMTDEDIIRRLQAVTGAGQVRGPYSPRSHELGTKPQWVWCVSKRADVHRIIGAVYPLLGDRRRQRIADLMPRLNRTGLCRNGLHPKEEGSGKCPECKRATEARWRAANAELANERSRLSASKRRERERTPGV